MNARDYVYESIDEVSTVLEIVAEAWAAELRDLPTEDMTVSEVREIMELSRDFQILAKNGVRAELVKGEADKTLMAFTKLAALAKGNKSNFLQKLRRQHRDDLS